MNTVFFSFTYDFHAQWKPFVRRCGSCEHNITHKIATTSGTAEACMGYDQSWSRSRCAHVPECAHKDLEPVCSKYFRCEEKTEVNELTGSTGISTEK